MTCTLRTECLVELLRVSNPPPCPGVDLNIQLIVGQNILGVSVPFPKSSIDQRDLVNERNLELQARFGPRGDDPSKLGHNRELIDANNVE